MANQSHQTEIYTIICAILGETTSFSVKIASNEIVDQLKKAIKEEKKPELDHIAADKLSLYHVEIPDSEDVAEAVKQKLLEHPAKLLPTEELAAVFKNGLKWRTVHIVVQLQTSHKRIASHEVDDPNARKQEIKKLHDGAVQAGKEGKAPSSAARPENMVLEQRDHPIANGRPNHEIGPPIHLYHPVFLEFDSKVKEKSVEIPVDFQLLVCTFLTKASAIYSTEYHRRMAVDDLLSQILGFPIMATQLLDGTSNDGCITIPVNFHKALLLLLETKNEVGTGGCDPSAQAAYSTRKFWVNEKDKHFRDNTCCPTFIVSTAGPWLQIQGFILVDAVVVQPLTDYIWLGGVPNVGRHIEKVAKVLFALSHSLKTLARYYTDLSIPAVNSFASFFPHITQYSTGDRKLITFSYKERLFPRGSRAVFSAQDKNGRDVVVKFTPTYNAEAHRLLAEAGLAPALYYASNCIAAPGYMMVVMEMLTGKDAVRLGMQKLTEERYKKVEQAVTLLHSSGYVFGDLRPVNIVITGVDDVRLVDFDWCGKEDVDRYPITLNDTGAIRWPDGVGRCKPMKKEHDLKMLNRLRGS